MISKIQKTLVALCCSMAVFCACNTTQTGVLLKEAEISLDNELLTVSEAGLTDYELKVTAKGDWTIQPVIVNPETQGDAIDWVHFEPMSGAAGETTVKVTVDPTDVENVPRGASYLFSMDEFNYTSFNVRQEHFQLNEIRLAGAMPAADKALDTKVRVYFSGSTGVQTLKMTVSHDKDLVELTKAEYEVVFPTGSGFVEVPLEGNGLKLGMGVFHVSIADKTADLDFKVLGYMKIKDLIADIYPAIANTASPQKNPAFLVKEDLLVKGVVVSNYGYASLNEMYIQDSKDPNSAIILQGQNKFGQPYKMGAVVEVNLKGYNLNYNVFGQRYVRKPTGDMQIKLLEEPDMKRVDELTVHFDSHKDFQKNCKAYDAMMVEVNDVQISEAYAGRAINLGVPPPAPLAFIYIDPATVTPDKTQLDRFTIAVFKSAPFAKDILQKSTIKRLRGLSLEQPEPHPASQTSFICKQCIYPQLPEDFVRE